MESSLARTTAIRRGLRRGVRPGRGRAWVALRCAFGAFTRWATRPRPRLAVVGLVGCAALVAACGSSGQTSSTSHSAVKVGYLLPLTGVFTKNGSSEQNGFKLGLKHFGNSVDGHPIQVTYANDQGEPSVSLSDARQLVTSDHVQVVEGPLVSSAIAAVAPYVLGQGIPEDDLVPGQPAAGSRTTPCSAWASPPTGTASQPTTVGGRWAYNTMDWRHVTTVGLGISYGWQGVGGFAAQFTKLGGKIDKKIWVPSNSVDMSAYVSAIPASTQAVCVVLSGTQAANFVNAYQSFGLKGKIPLMGITTLTDQAALPAENAAAAPGVYTDSQYCDDAPGRSTRPSRTRTTPRTACTRRTTPRPVTPRPRSWSPRSNRSTARSPARRRSRPRCARSHHRTARAGDTEPRHLVAGGERVHLQGRERPGHPAERADRDLPGRPALGHPLAIVLAAIFAKTSVGPPSY